TAPHRDDQGRWLHRPDYRAHRLVRLGGRRLERHRRREAPVPRGEAANQLSRYLALALGSIRSPALLFSGVIGRPSMKPDSVRRANGSRKEEHGAEREAA